MILGLAGLPLLLDSASVVCVLLYVEYGDYDVLACIDRLLLVARTQTMQRWCCPFPEVGPIASVLSLLFLSECVCAFAAEIRFVNLSEMSP